MSTEKYDVVILGGGNAGMGVTVATRAAGLSVAMIEARDLGGTCPNRGCTPKKILVAAAHALHEIERAVEHRIAVAKPKLDWAALIDREKAMIAGIPDRLAGVMSRRGVDVVFGEAAFVDSNTIKVGERRLEAANIVIATGSKPRPLAFPGAEHLVTSDEVLSDPTVPDEVVFIGGGVISFELGHVYARAGAKVTIIEVLPQLLGGVDSDAVEQICGESRRIGMRLLTFAQVKRIDRVGRRLSVVFAKNGIEDALTVDRIVNCAGRVANVESLALDTGEVSHREGRIDVDEFLRSRSNPNVYICGDALWNSPQLSPVATFEGRLVGRNIAEGAKHKPDYALIPSSVYTIPAVASVGLTEEMAKQKGLAVKVHVNDMSDWLSAKTYAETVAWSKVIVDEATNLILGAHIVGHAGEELINTFALAMQHGITAAELSERLYSFPTFSADIKSMM
jgi:glutathione reductase (NADPH)